MGLPAGIVPLAVLLAVVLGGCESGPNGPEEASGPAPGLSAADSALDAAIGDLATTLASIESEGGQPVPSRLAVGLGRVDNMTGADAERFEPFRRRLVRSIARLGEARGLVFVEDADLRQYVLRAHVIDMAEADDRWMVQLILRRHGRTVWDQAVTVAR